MEEKLPLVELARQALARGNALKAVELLEEEIKKLLEQNKLLEEQKKDSKGPKIDKLTGLFNKEMYLEILYPAYMHSYKTKQPLGQIAFDIHGINVINEEQGWQAGNDYLTKIGGIIRKVLAEKLTSIDMAFRPGGDEMIILLPNTTPEGVDKAAQFFLDAFREQNIEVAVGYGIIDTTDVNSMIESNNKIDKVLYESKTQAHAKEAQQQEEQGNKQTNPVQ